METGHQQTKLIVLRGNSGSGKSTTAKELRRRTGRGTAWVEQDYLRRILLREHDVPDGVNIGLIDQTVRYALDQHYHVILEGILYSAHYGAMLSDLHRDHLGLTRFYYFDIPFAETVRRHTTRPQAADFTPEQMREWYTERDLLGLPGEQLIDVSATLEATVQRVAAETHLVNATTHPTHRPTPRSKRDESAAP